MCNYSAIIRAAQCILILSLALKWQVYMRWLYSRAQNYS